MNIKRINEHNFRFDQLGNYANIMSHSVKDDATFRSPRIECGQTLGRYKARVTHWFLQQFHHAVI
jgi:hypothetical protein